MNRTKTATRVLSALAALLLLLASLTACSGGVTREETQAASEALFAALSNADYEAVSAMFHPDKTVSTDKLSSYCEMLVTDYGVDLTEGATIERYTGMKSAYYDSEVRGSLYELVMDVKVGEITAVFRVQVVRSDTGFGIWNFAFVRP